MCEAQTVSIDHTWISTSGGLCDFTPAVFLLFFLFCFVLFFFKFQFQAFFFNLLCFDQVRLSFSTATTRGAGAAAAAAVLLLLLLLYVILSIFFSYRLVLLFFVPFERGTYL